MIHIGDTYGKISDDIKFYNKYRKFKKETKIIFNNPKDCKETIERREYENYEKFIPKQGDIVYDIGAGIGDYSLIWGNYYDAYVIAFEPLLSKYSEMLINFELNDANYIERYNYLIGDGNPMAIYDNSKMINNLGNGNKYVKDTVSIDNFLLENDLEDKPNIVKIDTEGFEKIILEGMRKTLANYKPKIIIETHSIDLLWSCHKLLIEYKYELFKSQINGKDTFELFYEVV